MHKKPPNGLPKGGFFELKKEVIKSVMLIHYKVKNPVITLHYYIILL
jgi:hypothetical protein|nr:MAG TPA: hypothetical protein [Caudoviricetes sp.]